MNRIDEKFKQLKSENKKAFIAYICGGDPTLEATEDIVLALEEAGTDILEIGIPFSDPLADGPIIQQASIRALTAGFKISKFFDTIKSVRKKSNMPLVVMVYYNSVFGYGVERFIKGCEEAGIDGIIIPDLPYEEYDEVMPVIEKTEIYLLPLVSVTSNERVPMLVEKAKGFVYCISSLGVTGYRDHFDNRTNDFVKYIQKYTDVPVCVGFGIAKREDLEWFNKTADGCIVGTAIVKKIFDSKMNLDEVKEFIRTEFTGK